MPDPKHARSARSPSLAVVPSADSLNVARARFLASVIPDAGPTRRQQRRVRREERKVIRRQARDDARARRAAADWTRPQRLLASLLAILTIGIAVPAFASLYHTTTTLLSPVMGDWARIVPICGEIAFTYLFLNGVLLALRRAPAGVLRSAFMAALMSGAVALQALASRGSVPALVGHEVVVTAFFGVLLSAKATILTLLGGKVKPDRITLAEWAAHPVQAGRLWRWRATWGQMKVSAARDRYMVLLYVTALVQAHPRVGSGPDWKDELPVTLRYQLATGQIPPAIAAGEGDWQEAARCHVAAQLELLPPLAPSEPEMPSPSKPETSPEADQPGKPEARAARRPAPRPEQAPKPALKLAAGKSRSMSASDLEPHVSAMLEEYGTASQARVKRDLHVSTDKAAEALRLAKQKRTVVPIGASR